jgi:hypothetical protein
VQLDLVSRLNAKSNFSITNSLGLQEASNYVTTKNNSQKDLLPTKLKTQLRHGPMRMRYVWAKDKENKMQIQNAKRCLHASKFPGMQS